MIGSSPQGAPGAFEPDRLAAIQGAFPVLERWTYLNTGTYGPMPAPALEAYIGAVTEMERDGVACGRPFAAESDALRSELAAMVGADPSEIGYTGNATDGINLVLAGLQWEHGDEVVTTDEEHEAMLHPLLYLGRTRGTVVKRVSCAPDPDTMLRRLDEACGPRTRLLAISHVTCETGTRLPAAGMFRWAHGRGVLCLLDVAQSLGVVPVRVGEVGCDFMAANGHKWLHGPKGTGFLYVRKDLIDKIRPAHVGAGSLEAADASTGVAEPHGSPRRFEFGTRAYGLLSGWGAALRWMRSVGLEAISSHSACMGESAIAMLRGVPGAQVLTPDEADGRAGLVSFRLEDRDAGALCARLHSQHAITVRYVPHFNAVRISMSQFTSEAHLERLMGALAAPDA